MSRQPRRRGSHGRREDPHKINERIKSQEIRLVGDNVEQGIYPTRKALEMARAQSLDLVEISPNATPPVCKIIDYSKFRYDQKKKQKELKAKAQKVVMKEIRFGPNTDDHDFNFKLKHAKNFLEGGAKLKAYVHFVGRTIVFKERGEQLLLKFALELDEYGKVEQMPRLEGKRMTLFMAPKATKKAIKPKKEEQDATNKRKNRGNKNQDKAKAEAESETDATTEAEVTTDAKVEATAEAKTAPATNDKEATKTEEKS